MWNMKISSMGAALLALASLACDRSGGGDVLSPELAKTGGGAVYEQVEFLGNPLVSEVTIMKLNHDRYNATQPYNTAEFLPQTAAFITGFGRPQSLASLLGSVLYPDILIVNTARDPATAGWLSWALADGWGGRKLADDVVDLGLTAIFSSFLEPAGALCPPFQLPLCTDNVDTNDKAFLTVFPYLATPTL